MLTNLLWLLAGVVIAGWWFWRSGSKRDYYVVETAGIMDDAGGKLTDINTISGGSVGMRVLYDLTWEGGSYAVRRKGQQQLFGAKSFDVFDDYAAAKEKFDQINQLFLSIPRSRHDPKILWVDDAEIVGDQITKVRPIPGTFSRRKLSVASANWAQVA